MHPKVYRLIWIGVAFATSWILYMVGMLLTSYDGLLSLIFQPIMAGIFSMVGIAVSLIVGLIFRYPPIGNWWRKSYLWAGLCVALGLTVLMLAYPLGFTITVQHFETSAELNIIIPELAITAWFLIVFALTNWPDKSRQSKNAGAPDRHGEPVEP